MAALDARASALDHLTQLIPLAASFDDGEEALFDHPRRARATAPRHPTRHHHDRPRPDRAALVHARVRQTRAPRRRDDRRRRRALPRRGGRARVARRPRRGRPDAREGETQKHKHKRRREQTRTRTPTRTRTRRRPRARREPRASRDVRGRPARRRFVFHGRRFDFRPRRLRADAFRALETFADVSEQVAGRADEATPPRRESPSERSRSASAFHRRADEENRSFDAENAWFAETFGRWGVAHAAMGAALRDVAPRLPRPRRDRRRDERDDEKDDARVPVRVSVGETRDPRDRRGGVCARTRPRRRRTSRTRTRSSTARGLWFAGSALDASRAVVAAWIPPRRSRGCHRRRRRRLRRRLERLFLDRIRRFDGGGVVRARRRRRCIGSRS